MNTIRGDEELAELRDVHSESSRLWRCPTCPVIVPGGATERIQEHEKQHEGES